MPNPFLFCEPHEITIQSERECMNSLVESRRSKRCSAARRSQSHSAGEPQLSRVSVQRIVREANVVKLVTAMAADGLAERWRRKELNLKSKSGRLRSGGEGGGQYQIEIKRRSRVFSGAEGGRELAVVVGEKKPSMPTPSFLFIFLPILSPAAGPMGRSTGRDATHAVVVMIYTDRVTFNSSFKVPM